MNAVVPLLFSWLITGLIIQKMLPEMFPTQTMMIYLTLITEWVWAWKALPKHFVLCWMVHDGNISIIKTSLCQVCYLMTLLHSPTIWHFVHHPKEPPGESFTIWYLYRNHSLFDYSGRFCDFQSQPCTPKEISQEKDKRLHYYVLTFWPMHLHFCFSVDPVLPS